ncbi:hypothetical protein NX059_007148 [Plenodomus lindquistii]|nr:hypothetical protein NX059_007148 [Plenodomus lindquistii]
MVQWPPHVAAERRARWPWWFATCCRPQCLCTRHWPGEPPCRPMAAMGTLRAPLGATRLRDQQNLARPLDGPGDGRLILICSLQALCLLISCCPAETLSRLTADCSLPDDCTAAVPFCPPLVAARYPPPATIVVVSCVLPVASAKPDRRLRTPQRRACLAALHRASHPPPHPRPRPFLRPLTPTYAHANRLRRCTTASPPPPPSPSPAAGPMAALKSDSAPHDAKPSSPLARVMREFEELVRNFEAGLLRSLADHGHGSPEAIRSQACRLAITDLSSRYTPKYIRRSLNAAESAGKRLEEQLSSLSLDTGRCDDDDDGLAGLHNGYFRLYSTELFDLLGQPAELRFGTLRFHKHRAAMRDTTHPSSPHDHDHDHDPVQSPWINVELALNNSFYVADSMETLPYHTFRLPSAPSLQNRGILSRKPEDNGAFPAYDSWLLFTFLGNGCIKLEVPIEMCADVYGGPLTGRENHEVLFWGFFVDDDDVDVA